MTLATLALSIALHIPQAAPLPTAALDGWLLEVRATGGLTMDLIDSYRAARWPQRDEDLPDAPIAFHAVPTTDAILRWRSLIAAHFPPEHVDEALTVLACESGGDPNATNPTSSAAGLFQHLPRYWPSRSAAAGVAGASIYDPEANVIVAAWLSSSGSSWAHWVCKPNR